MNRVVKASGSGFVDYLWPKPGSEEGVPKISFVMGFQPWGWVIGSGIYIGDVREATLRQMTWMSGVVAAALLLAG